MGPICIENYMKLNADTVEADKGIRLNRLIRNLPDAKSNI